MNNNILHNNNELYTTKVAILYIVIIFLQLY